MIQVATGQTTMYKTFLVPLVRLEVPLEVLDEDDEDEDGDKDDH
jgi:hypothetical protein